MLAQSYLVDEVKVGVEYLLWCMTAENLNEQGNDTLGYKRVAVGCEYKLSVDIVALQPNTALATFNEVGVVLVLCVKLVEVVA